MSLTFQLDSIQYRKRYLVVVLGGNYDMEEDQKRLNSLYPGWIAWNGDNGKIPDRVFFDGKLPTLEEYPLDKLQQIWRQQVKDDISRIWTKFQLPKLDLLVIDRITLQHLFHSHWYVKDESFTEREMWRMLSGEQFEIIRSSALTYVLTILIKTTLKEGGDLNVDIGILKREDRKLIKQTFKNMKPIQNDPLQEAEAFANGMYKWTPHRVLFTGFQPQNLPNVPLFKLPS